MPSNSLDTAANHPSIARIPITLIMSHPRPKTLEDLGWSRYWRKSYRMGRGRDQSRILARARGVHQKADLRRSRSVRRSSWNIIEMEVQGYILQYQIKISLIDTSFNIDRLIG